MNKAITAVVSFMLLIHPLPVVQISGRAIMYYSIVLRTRSGRVRRIGHKYYSVESKATGGKLRHTVIAERENISPYVKAGKVVE